MSISFLFTPVSGIYPHVIYGRIQSEKSYYNHLAPDKIYTPKCRGCHMNDVQLSWEVHVTALTLYGTTKTCRNKRNLHAPAKDRSVIC